MPRPHHPRPLPDTTTRPADQPMPTRNDQPSIQSRLRVFLDEREQVGIRTYGTSLQPFNGRDPLRDALEEAVDLSLYLMQVMVERDTRPAPTVPCERCGQADATAAVIITLAEMRFRQVFVVCPACQADYDREGREKGAQVTALPVYPPAPGTPAGVPAADLTDKVAGVIRDVLFTYANIGRGSADAIEQYALAGARAVLALVAAQPTPDAPDEPDRRAEAVPTSEHVRQLRGAAATLATLAAAVRRQYPASNPVPYPRMVAGALDRPISDLAAVFTPDVAEEIGRVFERIADAIEQWENSLGHRIHPLDQALLKLTPAVIAAVNVNTAWEQTR